ncbi:MAG: hypothetical protein ACYDH9_20755 [Limisphaerales bacterium]
MDWLRICAARLREIAGEVGGQGEGRREQFGFHSRIEMSRAGVTTCRAGRSRASMRISSSLQTTGLHLKNENTKYKQSVFAVCNRHAKRKAWNELVPAMRDKEISYQVAFQDEWEKRLNELLAEE